VFAKIIIFGIIVWASSPITLWKNIETSR